MNPELRRNLWLEFSTHRLIAVPAVIVLIVLLVMSAADTNADSILKWCAGMGYGAMVLLWGTQLAAAGVLEEARARTWDTQRMSSISPWAMTWGKLVGATAFAWYNGAFMIVIYAIAAWNKGEPHVATSALLMFASGILAHAVALNASVLAARKGITHRGFGFVVALLILAIGGKAFNRLDAVVVWWGATWPLIHFLLVASIAFGAWAVLGAYRSMCNELEIRTRPWALPTFLLFCAAFVGGFDVNGSALNTVAISGVIVSLTALYLLLVSEQRGVAVWHRINTRVRAAHWRRVLEELPLWVVALLMGAVFAMVAVASARPNTLGASMLVLVFFAARDAAIFQFFTFSPQPRREITAAIFYLALLYGLIPGLFSVAGGIAIAQLFWPVVIERPVFFSMVGLVHATVAISLAVRRWRIHHAPDSLSTSTSVSTSVSTPISAVKPALPESKISSNYSA